MSAFKEGDQVRVTFDCEISWADGDLLEGVADGYVFPLQLTGGVSVEPADAPTPYERALTTLADNIADLNATAERCDNAGRPSLAIEHRDRADAVRLALISVIEVGGVETDAAIVRAHALIAEAVIRRG
jgi:hypothetical protein